MRIRCNISKGASGAKAGCGRTNDYTADHVCRWEYHEPFGFWLCCNFCGYPMVLLETLLKQGYLTRTEVQEIEDNVLKIETKLYLEE